MNSKKRQEKCKKSLILLLTLTNNDAMVFVKELSIGGKILHILQNK